MHYQSSGSNHATTDDCEKMDRMLIIVVELNLCRNPLFTHEYAHANREGAPLCSIGKNLFYLKRHIFRIIKSVKDGKL